MLCKDCKYFKIRQQPLRVGSDIYDCGMAECTKHNLIVEFTHKGKFKWLSCVEEEMDVCGDNRFEIIAKAKKHLLEATNIDTSPDEMKVLDDFLFRCWQMGWLDRYDSNG